MSYLVLARKYRPQQFDELIGQEHITEIIEKALKSDRLAHAYLFCGPRGIGKTSCARILAKALNCEKGPAIKPCNQCPICEDINKGSSFDVLEIDGASNRGIDEIRSLRENVKFAPNYSRYKIYIVDEVHMLTTEAFNALLKTLEEPPSHVKFFFATTEPHKVPSTIISRCQRFDFKRIRIQTIVDLLTQISKKEKLKIDAEALYAIAKAAKGSMRDALSILDQISALSDREIGSEDVFSMLGLVETDLLFQLVDALGNNDCRQALKTLETVIDKGKDIRQLSRDITEHFRHLMVIKVGGKALGKLVDYPIHIKEMLLQQCDLFSLKDILVAIDTLVQAQDTARITESNRLPLEVAFAKIIYTGEEPTPGKPKGDEAQGRKAGKSLVKGLPPKGYSPINVLKNKKGEVRTFPDNTEEEPRKSKARKKKNTSGTGTPAQADIEQEEVIEELGAEMAVDEAVEVNLERLKRSWDSITYSISRKKMSVATYLQDGTPVELNKEKLVIGLPPSHKFQKEALEDQRNVRLIENVLHERIRRAISVEFRLVTEEISKDEDDDVKDVLDTFKGKVVDRWHHD